MKRRRKVNKKKVFCAISIGFLVGCFLFYGIRFITLYIDNKKIEDNSSSNLAQVVKKDNFGKDNFKNISNAYYFFKEANNNYLLYSNILWRIVKIEKDNSIMLISENSLTSLAFDDEVSNFTSSSVNEWLNSNDSSNTGILEEALNKKEKYLKNAFTCLDTVDKANNNICKESNEDNYISLLSMTDYINTGASKGFINNESDFYLSTLNSDNKVWYVSEKLDTTDGTETYGIRPVIYLNGNVELVNGKGTVKKPYTIEKETELFGSYVKLDEQLWRVYQVNDNKVKLSLTNYINSNDNPLEYNYSNNGYIWNDTKTQTAAYYLNHTFLNKLTYKDKIEEIDWANGFYGADNNYDYKETLTTTIKTKVAMLSVGDIMLTDKLSDFFTMTGTTKNGNLVYTLSGGQLTIANSSDENYLVPTISIDKDLLKTGKGTKDDPYGME